MGRSQELISESVTPSSLTLGDCLKQFSLVTKEVSRSTELLGKKGTLDNVWGGGVGL